MERKKRWRILIWMIVVVNAALIVVIAVSAKPEEIKSEMKSKAAWGSVKIPDSAFFAGEKVPLERFDVKEALDRELIVNSYFHSQTIRLIKMEPRYFRIIEPILKDKGIPEDFKYLAVAESGFNTRAVSGAGAVGFWQFLKGTARDYGLEVNAEVDERYHVEKATHAACNYMKDAYERYGSWTLVAASFNAGMRGVERQIERQKTKFYYDLLFTEETQRYVFRIIALKQVLENPEKYNFYISEVEKYPLIETKEVVVQIPVTDFADFAHKYGISYKLLKDFNPWLRENFLTNPTGKKYIIKNSGILETGTKRRMQEPNTDTIQISDKDLNANEKIIIHGAREHNLRNIDVEIPRNKLTVITGLSGSGKSSLAFDTIYAEGQRRYIETFSAYARSFLGNLERPDVDKITGLSPVIAIEQKVTTRNPRSTVGTVTEIYDFLRLLYARAAEAFSYNTGEKMVKYSEEKILQLIETDFYGKRINILAPVVKGRKGHYRELFEQIRRKGFLYARVDGEVTEIKHNHRVDRYKNHFIEIIVDKLKVEELVRKRLKESVQTAIKHGHGVLMIMDHDSGEAKYYSRLLMCPTTGISYNEPAPHNFSFNSPQGACPKCNGLGRTNEIDLDKIAPDKNKSITKGGIVPLGSYRNTLIFWQIEALGEKFGFTLKTPIKEISEEGLQAILFGTNERIQLKNTPLGTNMNYMMSYEGIVKYIESQREDNPSKKAQKWATQFIKTTVCKECEGMRLKKESLHFKIDGKNISEIANLDLDELGAWFEGLENRLNERQRKIGTEVIKEIRDRLGFMLGVGLNYLALDRTAQSLSGGESQRIRLATQIGSQLVNVLYILDEPSIGLHHRDNLKLIHALQQLRDSGNSVIVVEHDKETMLHADYLIDMGPLAGIHGGNIVAAGHPKEVLKYKTLTSDYLNNKKLIAVPPNRRVGKNKFLIVKGCAGNNLKNITLEIPLGKFICVTGVSGSGKSTLINDTLQPILSQYFYKSVQDPLPYKSIEGLDNVDKVIRVDQSPIGRTPRSNPVTYTGVFTDIRALFAQLPEAKIRGYKPGRFSFNVVGGRCEECKGGGLKLIEMNFLPDVYVHCDKCNGKRYNRETLEVRYKGKSISDILDMTINQGVTFFESIPSILLKLQTLQEVGLGYITLGQSSTTLSGGESQRVKLASELAKRDTGKTLYILDEPTTGLHFEDIRVLLEVLNKLVDKGNTVIVIEHNMDVIKVADHIIDIGPEGGKHGGKIICSGTPEEIIKIKKSYTAGYLKKELKDSA